MNQVKKLVQVIDKASISYTSITIFNCYLLNRADMLSY